MRRISRRRFLGAGAATAAAASALVLGACGDPKKRAVPTPLASPSPAPSKAVSRGGILRAYNFDAQVQDTLDPHQTQFGPVANMHSAVFSRLLQYADERNGTIVPDLAESLPEQPDPLTYIFKLRDGVAFHDAPKYRLAFPNTAGRPLVAGDVKYSIERQINRNSPKAGRYYRSSDWSVIDSIDATDNATLVIRLKNPVAPFLSFLAGRHAFVIARETVDAATDETHGDLAMMGTGPFMLESWEPGTAAKLRRNPRWFRRDDDAASGIGADRPFLDGYDAFFSPQEDVFQRMAFSRRFVDTTGFLDPAALDNERKTNLADLVLEETNAGGFIASRFLLDRAPFKDDRLRRAIHLAVDRQALADLLYPPMDGRASARLTGPIAPALDRWAVAQEDLERRPGYRQQRDEDAAQARQLWAAGMGDGRVNELRVFFSGVPRIVPERAVPALQRMLQDVLGVTVVPQVDPSGNAVIGSALTRNIEGAADGVVPFTFGFEDGGVDLDDCLYPHFRSAQPMNTYRLQDATLDSQLDKQRAEFDNDERHKLGLAIQDYLLAKVNARIEYLAPIDRRLTWGYVRNSHHPIWYGSNQALADTWLDTSHPAWSGRPA
ncbi:MAG TPA: ABC transporter substrate-binding protein [Dehalococcoidia bacterium]